MLSREQIEQTLREREIGELYEGEILIDKTWHKAYWYYWEGKVVALIQMPFGQMTMFLCLKNGYAIVRKVWRIKNGKLESVKGEEYYFNTG